MAVSTTTSTSVTSATGKVNDVTQANLNRYQQDYTPSADVVNAKNNLNQVLSNKPGAFTSAHQPQMDMLYDKIINRPDFKYDMNADALYNQYKEQYITQGQNAMRDTVGQVSALTGGYANSYAQTAGQQAYQQYLTQLNNMIPELYDRARNAYNDKTNLLMNQYGLASDAYNRDYSQYRDTVSDWQNERDFSYNRYNSERDFDWNKFSSNRDYWTNEYWNERNAEKTTTSTSSTVTESGGSGGSGGGGGRSSGGSGSNNTYADGGYVAVRKVDGNWVYDNWNTVLPNQTKTIAQNLSDRRSGK